ncbi:transmembrane protease serine 11B-like [Daphnia pulicaria]|uniref:transmembrane protease serine 11B-like n=1 Tax=Daphnia pulicaria TaxID=35523 RepID=UPI001EEA5A9A|nr:transmembrane protease serine 11B-like [Daphnia pulicaria]
MNSSWELNNAAPKPPAGRNYMRVDRGATLSFGIAVLRSPTFQIPASSNNNISISFDFWIRSKWPQFTNLELYLNENGNERLLVSLWNYSDINNRNWVTSPVLPVRSQSPLSSLSLVFYAYCGTNVEDAVAIDNIRLIDSSLTSTVTVPTSTDESVTTVTQCPTATSSNKNRAMTVKDERNVKGKIVGGEETTPNEFPWMAHLKTIYWSGDSSNCSGTLIGNRWILTAAHCFFGCISVEIRLGAHDVSSNSLEQHQLLYNSTPTHYYFHPDWFLFKVEDDIGLIELKEDVSLSQYIRPIRLPNRYDPDQVGDSVVMVGWGNYSDIHDSGVSPVLRKVSATVIPHDICQEEAKAGNFSNDKVICTDGSQGKRYCYGDGGGPMLHYREDIQEWVIIGVASVGDPSTNCQGSGKPNLYERVRNYLDWILGHTGIEEELTTTTPITTTSITTPVNAGTTTSDPNELICP